MTYPHFSTLWLKPALLDRLQHALPRTRQSSLPSQIAGGLQLQIFQILLTRPLALERLQAGRGDASTQVSQTADQRAQGEIGGFLIRRCVAQEKSPIGVHAHGNESAQQEDKLVQFGEQKKELHGKHLGAQQGT